MAVTTFTAAGRDVPSEINLRLQDDVPARDAAQACFGAVVENEWDRTFRIVVDHTRGSAVSVEVAATGPAPQPIAAHPADHDTKLDGVAQRDIGHWNTDKEGA